MRFISFFIFFLSGFVVNSTFSSDEVSKSLESYRPGNVYEEIDISSYPQPTSAKDGIQLCHSLIEGEIQYWEDSKTSMLNDNPRLETLVSLIAKNKMDLGLRLRLLEKKEDNDMYSLYKSYETIIEGLQSFSSILNGISVPEFPSGNQEGLLLIGSALKGLSEKNTEILKKNMLLRGILNSSVLGKSKFDVIQGEKGKFQPGTKSDSGQYDFCDVEYISVVFFPVSTNLIRRRQG